MISASDLQRVQLKSRQPTASPAEPPQAHASGSENHASAVARERELQSRLRAVDLEAWYAALEPFTYRTVFLPLSIQQARAMAAVYHKLRRAWREAHSAVEDLGGMEAFVRERLSAWRESGDADALTLAELQAVIEGAMSELAASGGGVFAKLSSRSPKDSTIRQARAYDLVGARLAAVKAATQAVTSNDISCALMCASVQCLRARSAAEVMEMFLTSDRVCEDDIPLALEHAHLWTQHIVLREWVDVPPPFEFRGFVFGDRLTALSQYFNNGYFPEVVEHRDLVLRLVHDTFDRMRALVPLEPKEYVVDFAVDVAARRAYVIELNPFGAPDGMGTGTAMFDLRAPADRETLFGRAPFEFRVETAPSSVSLRTHGHWHAFLEREGYDLKDC